MQKLLIVNACVRREISRTNRLCRALTKALCRREDCEITELTLEDESIAPLDGAALSRRETLLFQNKLDAPEFRYARLLRAADVLVVAAPYWDLSFPASLKCFFEAASINGLTFRYDENDRPVGLCRAKKLYYVTTSGGYMGSFNLGFDYVRALCATLYGISNARCFCAEGLDIAGAKPEEILRAAQTEIEAHFC